jgi:hypothetical protein
MQQASMASAWTEELIILTGRRVVAAAANDATTQDIRKCC